MAYPDYGAFLPTEALYSEPGAYRGVLKGEALKRASYLSEMDRFYEELRESSERFEKQYTLAEMEMDLTKEQALWEREFSEGQMRMGREQSLWEREFSEEQMKLGKEQSLWEKEFSEEQMEMGKEQALWERELAEKQMEMGREQSLWEREFGEEQMKMGKEQALWERELEESRFAHEEKLARIGSSPQRSSAQLQYDLGLKELDFRKKVEEKQLSEREEWDIASTYLSKIAAPTSKRVALTAEQKIAPIVSGGETTEVQTLFTPKLDKFGYRTY